ncbi:MAG: hypothetical protein HWN81_00415 [Candidatus Lokiarchaeota archaeon]|nr:hypothetical protein [Candidatus Lokiarchaeota archaeon]
MIISIIGRIRSGKSTVRKLIEQEAATYGITFKHVRFADPIYKEVEDFYDRWDIPYRKFRPLFDAIGEVLAEHGKGDKVNQYFVDQLLHTRGNIIVDDCRRISQTDFLKWDGTITIRVNSDNTTRKERCAPGEWTDNHISDTELDRYPVDFNIKNDGSLENLKSAVKDVCKNIFSRIKT